MYGYQTNNCQHTPRLHITMDMHVVEAKHGRRQSSMEQLSKCSNHGSSTLYGLPGKPDPCKDANQSNKEVGPSTATQDASKKLYALKQAKDACIRMLTMRWVHAATSKRHDVPEHTLSNRVWLCFEPKCFACLLGDSRQFVPAHHMSSKHVNI